MPPATVSADDRGPGRPGGAGGPSPSPNPPGASHLSRLLHHGVPTQRTPSPRRIRSKPALISASGSAPLTTVARAMRPDSTTATISRDSPPPPPPPPAAAQAAHDPQLVEHPLARVDRDGLAREADHHQPAALADQVEREVYGLRRADDLEGYIHTAV